MHRYLSPTDRRAFEWMNEFGVMHELDAPMPEIGLKAIAAALECDVKKLPAMLKLPLIPQMFAVSSSVCRLF